ncbi:MAG: hypothetical protein ACI9QD_000519 [Thermoproteota archaeon]|jgi:hypothetical protein
MIWKSLLKKPILAIGIIMMGLFLYDLKHRRETGQSPYLRDVFNTWSCRPIQEKIKRLVPATWSITCTKNNMTFKVKENDVGSNPRVYLYREMANYLMFISKVSPEENLERTLLVHLELDSPTLKINAIIQGDMLSKLKNLKTNSFIKQHLKETVKVKETIK